MLFSLPKIVFYHSVGAAVFHAIRTFHDAGKALGRGQNKAFVGDNRFSFFFSVSADEAFLLYAQALFIQIPNREEALRFFPTPIAKGSPLIALVSARHAGKGFSARKLN